MKVMIARWIAQLLTSTRLRAVRRGIAALPRRLHLAPARVQYFHQLDDPYSHLLVQLLPALLANYRVALEIHLVPAPVSSAAPEQARLQAWSRRDAVLLAQQLRLQFPHDAAQPDAARLLQAQMVAWQALAGTDRLAQLQQIGAALWSGAPLPILASAAPASVTLPELLAQGAHLRRKLGHYLGATLFFESEWFWGVDRLQHLEQRLRARGLQRLPAAQWLAPIPDVACVARQRNGARPQLHFYCSFRSPYTYLAVSRVRRLAEHYGADLQLRFVLPMAMRGLPVPLEKRLYIIRDCKREAERLGLRFGCIADPLGVPTERGLAVLHQAMQQGKGPAFAESFLQGVFADGIDAGSAAGLQRLAARADLAPQTVEQALADQSWRDVAEANRAEMFALGLWGVPSFRLDNGPAYWGQDRLWLIERELIAATAAQ